MNLQKKVGFGLVALALVLVFAAAPASAQQIYKAKFTQPFQAQWGNTVIEAGDYTITIEQYATQKLLRLHGAGEVALLAGPTLHGEYSDTGRLTFIEVNGVMVLKEFEAGEIGQSFVIPLPKIKRDQAANTSNESHVVTLVATR